MADLYAILIDPLAGSLHGISSLIIVPPGPLHAVPFHALHNGERYLIEDYEISFSPSASLLQYLQVAPRVGPQVGREQTSVVLGVADEAAPHIDDEVRSVAKALGNARLLTGESATSKNLARETRQASIVHLACHARFSPEAPLVVLSGCDTACSAIGGGDEVGSASFGRSSLRGPPPWL